MLAVRDAGENMGGGGGGIIFDVDCVDLVHFFQLMRCAVMTTMQRLHILYRIRRLILSLWMVEGVPCRRVDFMDPRLRCHALLHPLHLSRAIVRLHSVLGMSRLLFWDREKALREILSARRVKARP